MTLGVLLFAGAAGLYGYYWNLRSTMDAHDLEDTLAEEERPPKIGDDVTVLLIGSDGNDGHDGQYGGQDFEGERADTLLLVHISPERESVTAVNFPRDSLVQLPECAPYEDTEGTAGYYGMINASLFHGGPPCVVKTIETLTDIRVDHFAHVGFAGFEDMVDAIGGVEMCLPEPVQDERAHLDLDAGLQTLDGADALSFVRARYEIGDGGDQGRIDRQQMFLAALANEVSGGGLLTEPSQMVALLDAVSEHTSTDSDLGLDRILSIASTLADVDLNDIVFYTVPNWQAPSDPNRVVWNEDLAEPLFHAVAHDQPIDSVTRADLENTTDGEPDPGSSPTFPPDTTPGAAATPTPSYPAQEEPHDPPEDTEDGDGDGDGEETVIDDTGDAIGYRDGTANPCTDGLGTGTDDERENENTDADAR
ncbi:LCP family protein [Lipingzhangella sp. LS1_29]|uniref:LCP family protein n=1 Tax=Lipingzhangella rawalii TaxID=2055835 RepID=A0ABU2H4P6_9ACTN|nr:LCP family protein [Lipingzhangella rawalii]MDS1270277.1 LCP family protein [Lipingzhangella rawalii]